MKRIILLSLATLMSLYAQATFQTIYGREIVINGGMQENLYISAGTVRIDAPITGDILMCGGTLTINGTITGDVILLGGELVVNGQIDGSLRCLGGKLMLKGTVNKELAVASGEVICEPGSLVNGGIVASCGDLQLRGTVTGDVQCSAANAQLTGNIKGNLNCKGVNIYINGPVEGESILAASEIQIDDSAAFGDKVRYWDADGKVDFGRSLFGKEAIYDKSLEIEQSKWQYLGFSTILLLTWYLAAALLVIVVVQYLFRNIMKRAAKPSLTASWSSLAYGMALMVLVPLGIFLLVASLIGIPIGVVLFIIIFLLALFNSAILAVFLANLFNSRNGYRWHNSRLVGVAFLLFLLVKTISLIPILGWVIILIATAVMFGTFVRTIRLKPTI